MSSLQFEAFLARLYSDRAFLERFLSDPAAAASAANLDSREREAVAHIDLAGLLMAARSYELKRQRRRGRSAAVLAMFTRLARPVIDFQRHRR